MMEIDVRLTHVLQRPSMYFGTGPEASSSLAWFINGYMAAVDGFGKGSFFDTSMLIADPTKTLEDNAKDFQSRLLKENK